MGTDAGILEGAVQNQIHGDNRQGRGLLACDNLQEVQEVRDCRKKSFGAGDLTVSVRGSMQETCVTFGREALECEQGGIRGVVQEDASCRDRKEVWMWRDGFMEACSEIQSSSDSEVGAHERDAVLSGSQSKAEESLCEKEFLRREQSELEERSDPGKQESKGFRGVFEVEARGA